MNLYEFQGKEILQYFSINVPKGIVASSPDEAVKAAKKLFINRKSLVIKAQIHAGGRGKSGGIKIVNNIKDVYNISNKIIGSYLITPQTTKQGQLVKKILISEDVYCSNNIPTEYYISILFNREKSKNIILYSKYGGVNIEQFSKKYPDKIFIEELDPLIGLQLFQIRKIINNLSITDKIAIQNIKKFLISLNKAYHKSDSLLIEINPLIKTYNNYILPIDVKIILDDNALFRSQKYFTKSNDNDNVNFLEKEAMKYNIKFLKLSGNVGCMVNGAGLAMATMDMIQSCGGKPANFLDIGGDADKEKIEKALSIILKDKYVKIILINIFGGIVRCDIVATAIVNTYKKFLFLEKIPLIIRLQGTNEEKAKKILENKNNLPISISLVNTLKNASRKIKFFLDE